MLKLQQFATPLLVVLLLSSSQTFAQQSSVTSLESIPNSAAAYVHFDVPGLKQFQGMEFIKSLLLEVEQEIDTLTKEATGFRASELSDAAIVASATDLQMVQMGTPPDSPLALFSFSNPIDPQDFIDVHPGDWKRYNAAGRKIFMDSSSGYGLLHFADNAIAIGKKKQLTWFIQQRTEGTDNAKNKLKETFPIAREGQVTFGINGNALPQEFKGSLPPGFESLANLEWGAITLDLTDGFRIKQTTSFATASDAADTADQLHKMLTFVKMQLKGMESTAKRQFANRKSNAMELAAMNLSQLATSRYGLKIIKNIKTQQNENRLATEVHIKDFDAAPTVMICLAAIQSIGTSANRTFEEIANELSSK